MLKYRLTAIVAVMLFIAQIPSVLAQEPEKSSSQFLDGIAAIVNDGVVLTSELDEQTDMFMRRFVEQKVETPPLAQLREQVLERLIINRIQLQRAERAGLRLSDEALNSAIAQMAERNGMRFEDFPAELERTGVDYQLYREQMREQLVLDQLRQIDVINRIDVSEREIEQCLAYQNENVDANSEYKISHILVGVPSSATAEQFNEAAEEVGRLQKEIQDGADFAQIAIRSSDGQNALEGGDLGWRKGEELPTLFASVVQKLKAGEVSEPIRSASGFHLIRVEDMRGLAKRSEVKQSQVRHILVITNEIVDGATARQKLMDAKKRIAAGESFADLARLLSEDPGSGKLGGELGWMEPGAFVPQFEAVVDKIELNTISEPFETRFGWHILEVTDRRLFDNTDELKRRSCIGQIRSAKLDEETELWMRRLRDEAYVNSRI